MKYYGYISTFLVGFLTFWFGVDPLKTSNNVYIKPITDFLDNHIFGIIAFSSVGLLLKILRDKSYEKELKLSKAENEKLKTDLTNYSEALKDLSNDILRDFSTNNLDSLNEPQMRISLYVKNKDGNLYCLGRYSKNKKFGEISADTIYKDKGIISKSWVEGNNGECGLFDNSFPEITPTRNFKKYLKYQLDNYNLDKTYIQKMKMKSRLYYSYRVESEQGENLGVILIESLSNTKYSQEQLDELINELKSRLIIVLKSTINYLDAPKTYISNGI